MDGEPLEPLDIEGLDVAALIWMVCVVAYVGLAIYNVLHAIGGVHEFGTWEKVAALGTTGGPIVAVSCLAGIALAFMSKGAVARLAIVLAGVTGAWVFVAGVFNVASAVHRTSATAFSLSLGQANRGVEVIAGLAFAGLGLVVMMIAWRAGGARPAAPPEVS
jgi:hypothetical protein